MMSLEQLKKIIRNIIVKDTPLHPICPYCERDIYPADLIPQDEHDVDWDKMVMSVIAAVLFCLPILHERKK